MNPVTRTWILAAVLAAISTVPSRAADDPALLRDLTSVIALL